ncbi:MAG: 4-alpha-glucanotransferase [Myxococcota bacterium]
MLHELAECYGVTTSYIDGLGQRREPTTEALLAILRSLGAPIERPEDARDALHTIHARPWFDAPRRTLVAWDGALEPWHLSVPRGSEGHYRLEISVNGEVVVERTGMIGKNEAFVLSVPERLPLGFGQASVEIFDRRVSVSLISAPRRAWHPEDRALGVFAPVYGFRPADLASFRTFADWAGDAGANFVGPLPLLATFLDEPFDPSPYSPVSRLFWNELYLAPDHEDEDADASDYYDYRAAFHRCRERIRTRIDALGGIDPQTLLADAPETADYAAFRVGREASPQCFADSEFRHHFFGQRWVHEQLTELADAQALYLDLPLGVHRKGYDVARFPEQFLDGCSAGAPPDRAFPGGQHWGIAAPSPQGRALDGGDYLRCCVETHTRMASMLRIDHAMWLHRVFCIPDGMDARDGTYVTADPDPSYAVLTLLSHRHRCAMVGEDLGTVPPGVTERLVDQGFHRMHVGQLTTKLAPEEANVLASLNTHDLATFAGYVRGADLETHMEIGFLSPERTADALRERSQRIRVLEDRLEVTDRASLHSEWLLKLAASPARFVLVSLEDLWLEERPQNIPGTSMEQRLNFCRKFAESFHASSAELVSVLRKLRHAIDSTQ